MTPTARRILQTAAAHRRSRAVTRWFLHHAAVPETEGLAALKELEASGHLVRDRAGGGPYTVISTDEADETT